MPLLLTSINGNPNIGLYGFANSSFALLGNEVSQSTAEEIAKVLKVRVHRMTIAGTPLVGAFVAGNDHNIVVPDIIFDSELRTLDRADIPYKIIPTKLTALGNNILCNNQGALVHPEFSADVKKMIRQALAVTLHPGTIAEIPTVGSVGIGNRWGILLHRDATKAEQQHVQTLFGVPCETATINRGSPYLRSGVICNDQGMVVSDQSWGPEIGFIDESLFLRKQ
ncbi:MAG TPA: translation initiation factor IF-6 [Candidatus Nanoarchaeia archaeon]|nr:translation initiation factor IF-6 [Candidatus Nanoarchaeia archaeon]